MSDDPRSRSDAPDDDVKTDDSSSSDGDELSQLDDKSRALVERANAEAARFRRELRVATGAREAAETQLAEARKAQETETERLVREAEQRGFEKAAPRILEAELAIAAAGKLRDPSDAARLISDATRDELLAITDSAARRKRADEIVDELVEARPYMAVEQTTTPANGDDRGLVSQGGRSRSTARQTVDPNQWIRERARGR